MSAHITLGDEVRAARKPHQCEQCGGQISPGERYRRQWGVWDGTPGTYRAHLECDDAAAEYHQNNDLRYDEGVLLQNDIQMDDYPWLLAEYPAVAVRMGITSTKGTQP